MNSELLIAGLEFFRYAGDWTETSWISRDLFVEIFQDLNAETGFAPHGSEVWAAIAKAGGWSTSKPFVRWDRLHAAWYLAIEQSE